jgi:hypothetical protein
VRKGEFNREKAIFLARRFMIKSKNLERESREFESRAIQIFEKLGYCTCNYSYYRTDKSGNCTVCGKRSREEILTAMSLRERKETNEK